jgi:hypothetical protein
MCWQGFLGEFGRKFYGEPASKRKIQITAGQDRVMEALKFGKDEKKTAFQEERAGPYSRVDMSSEQAKCNG